MHIEEERVSCDVEGCMRVVTTLGFCEPHYRRWLKHGDPLWGIEPKPKPVRTLPVARCAVKGCEKPASVKVYCWGHYRKWQKYGDPLYVRVPAPPDPCILCDQPALAHGYCQTHYMRWYRYGDATIVNTPGNKKGWKKGAKNQ